MDFLAYIKDQWDNRTAPDSNLITDGDKIGIQNAIDEAAALLADGEKQ